MDTIVDKLEAMSAFVKVVALGNYAEAGRALGVTRSAVSKAVMELERLLAASRKRNCKSRAFTTNPRAS